MSAVTFDVKELFGCPQLLSSGDTTVSTEDLNGKIVLLYFSAHWCPPCRRFTPKLKIFYEKLKATRSDFEIVFVSSDKDEAGFKEYFAEMPWLALPFALRDQKNLLNKKFDVNGIPSLVILSASGDVISSDATELVGEDEEGTSFPWAAKPFSEIMAEGPLLTHTPEQPASIADLLKRDVIAFYFSAHWCGPCRGFTPVLAEQYAQLQAGDAGKTMEIVFCSSDSSEEEFAGYYAGMPWTAFPFNDPRGKALSRLFQVGGIPTLVTVKPDGTVLNLAAATSVRNGGTFPWNPVPTPALMDIEHKQAFEAFQAGLLVVLDRTATPDDAALEPFTTAVQGLASTNATRPLPVHGIYTPVKGNSDQLTDEQVRHCPAGHAMQEADAAAMMHHRCDICRGEVTGAGWRCGQCDFDRCIPCFESKKAGLPRYVGLLNYIKESCEVAVPEGVAGPLVFVCNGEGNSSAVLSGEITSAAIVDLVEQFAARPSGCGAGGCGDAACGDASCGAGGCGDASCGDASGGAGGCGDAACGDAACGDGASCSAGGCGDAVCADGASCSTGGCGDTACGDGACG